MRKADDVFFFTLIDFLIQVFFFGLVIYTFAQDTNTKLKDSHKSEHERVEALLKATGISNLTELSDELSKLAPIKELKGISDLIGQHGGIDQVKADVKVVADTGGADKIKERLDKLRKIEEGSGKPPCIYSEINGKKIPKQLATVIATDTHIKFNGNTEELTKVLNKLGHQYTDVEELTFEQFRKVFRTLPQAYPECRFTLNFLESTELVYARDSARNIFYLRYGKS